MMWQDEEPTSNPVVAYVAGERPVFSFQPRRQVVYEVMPGIDVVLGKMEADYRMMANTTFFFGTVQPLPLQPQIIIAFHSQYQRRQS